MAEIEKMTEVKKTKKEQKLFPYTPYYIPGEPREFDVHLNGKKYTVIRGKENLVPLGVKEILSNMEESREFAEEYANATAIKE